MAKSWRGNWRGIDVFSRALIGLLFFGLAGCLASPEPFKPTDFARIGVSATSDTRWVVTYVLPKPADELVFVRQPDDSRAKDWIAALRADPGMAALWAVIGEGAA